MTIPPAPALSSLQVQAQLLAAAVQDWADGYQPRAPHPATGPVCACPLCAVIASVGATSADTVRYAANALIAVLTSLSAGRPVA